MSTEYTDERLPVSAQPRVLVVGLDEADTSRRAAAYAVGVARREHARLVIVYVRGQPALSGMAGTYAAYEQTHDAVVAEIQALIDGAEQRGDAVPHDFLQRTGDVLTELVAVADEVRADEVIVGASARVGHKIAGSVGVRLVRKGAWPVTVVP